MDNATVYKAGTDEKIPVTQDWCDGAQTSMNKMWKQRDIVSRILKINPVRYDYVLSEIENILLNHSL